MKQALMGSIPAMAQVAQSELGPQGRVVAWSESVAREALRKEVGEHCCWGKGIVDSMQITNLGQTSSYYLKVTAFLETRNLEWTKEPYVQGTPVDGPAQGQAPAIWEMQVPQPAHFQSKNHQAVVPHTDFVSLCETCKGVGTCTCSNCTGQGTLICSRCSGQGTESCSKCRGSGVPHAVEADKNWNPQVMCDGSRAHERVEWLVKDQGMTEAAAKVRVKREFADCFRDMDLSGDWWDASVVCDGTPAGDRAKWLEDNENLSQKDARLRVRGEFPAAFKKRSRSMSGSSISQDWWNPTAMCDGTSAQDRAQWLVDNEGVTVGEARARLRKEFPAALGGLKWDPDAICDGTPAKDRADWLVNNEGMSASEAEKRVQSEFPDAFATAILRSRSSSARDLELASSWRPDEEDCCNNCTGKGRVTCGECAGRCRVDCKICQTRGVVTCPTCVGHGSLKSHLVLHVKWTNQEDEAVLCGQGAALRNDEVKSAQGPKFEVKGLPVQAVSQFGPEVHQTTQQLCDKACSYSNQGYLHMQKLLVKQVPVCKVTASNNGQVFEYMIFGEDMRVNADNYPSKCCWGCTIA